MARRSGSLQSFASHRGFGFPELATPQFAHVAVQSLLGLVQADSQQNFALHRILFVSSHLGRVAVRA
jgi:hypothetical protein